jgi:hypothetical protein
MGQLHHTIEMQMLFQVAFVFLLLTAITVVDSCGTLKSCVDDATAAHSILNVTLPPVLQASTGNCNVSIIGNTIFNRVVVSGSGPSRTVIDCTSSGRKICCSIEQPASFTEIIFPLQAHAA